ncbi:diguanylate cyclase [Marichromatium bheemlicum]|uniref:Diguanylate cyclase n=1 Tax=Marichromatium bheemlicum TaxID=365339 RepID=A0ABX1I613_9GAMM|nr:diguanylate cyclase [Marichromatium bheemlicum]NKN32718.1 diguanylate cyclase [Marichromatium bheemlicum]
MRRRPDHSPAAPKHQPGAERTDAPTPTTPSRHPTRDWLRRHANTDGQWLLRGLKPPGTAAATTATVDWTMAILAEDCATLQQCINEAERTHTPWQHDCRIRDQAGALRWIRLQAHPDNSTSGWSLALCEITDLKAREQRLRLSETRYRAIVGLQSDLVCRFLPDNTITFVNDAYSSFFGRNRGELIGTDFMDLIPESELETVDTLLSQCDAEQPMVVSEHWVVRADGERRWVQWVDQAILDPEGRLLEIQSVGRDTTEQRRLEFRERLRNQVLERLVSGAPLAEVLEIIATGFEQEGKAHCSILLLDRDGERLYTAAAPSLPEDYNQAIDGLAIGAEAGACGRAATTGQRVVVEDIATHPLCRSLREPAYQAGLAACWSEPIRASDGRVLGTFAIYHDQPQGPTAADLERIELVINLASIAIERTQASEALRASEERLSLVLRGTEDGWWDWDLTSDRVFYSLRWWEMLGYDEGALEADRYLWRLLIHPEDQARVQEVFDQALASTSSAYSIEFRLLHRNGHYVPVLSRGFIQRDPSGRPLRVAGANTDLTERKRLEQRLRELANTDDLTGLTNRRHFFTKLQHALDRTRRHHTATAVLMLDLDHFKQINDSYGHGGGDAVLRAFAAVLRAELRSTDCAGRLGGEEFAVLVPDSDLDAAHQFAERLRGHIAALRVEHKETVIEVTVSIGCTQVEADDRDPDSILARADEALYRAKRNGRDRVERA